MHSPEYLMFLIYSFVSVINCRCLFLLTCNWRRKKKKKKDEFLNNHTGAVLVWKIRESEMAWLDLKNVIKGEKVQTAIMEFFW